MRRGWRNVVYCLLTLPPPLVVAVVLDASNISCLTSTIFGFGTLLSKNDRCAPSFFEVFELMAPPRTDAGPVGVSGGRIHLLRTSPAFFTGAAVSFDKNNSLFDLNVFIVDLIYFYFLVLFYTILGSIFIFFENILTIF
jgi:hypothetical protein